MNSVDRILGEATRKVRPPTKKELTGPYDAYWYAIRVLKGRFPEGEAAIATVPAPAYGYARDVIGGRFPEGEAAIATHPDYAYFYAEDVLKGRWPEGEAAIATVPHRAKEYLLQFPEAKIEWAINGWLDWTDL
jgi:hypothetical protein